MSADTNAERAHYTVWTYPISSLSSRGDTVGAVFFPARAARYGRVKPHVWPDRDVVTAWTDVAEHLDAHALELNAWTIGLFQP